MGYKYPDKNEKRREQRFCLAVVQNIGPREKQNKYLSTEWQKAWDHNEFFGAWIKYDE